MGESLAKLCSHPKVSLLDLHDFNIRYKVSIRCWLILPLVSLLVVVSWNLVVLLMYDRAGDSKGGNLSHRHPYSQFQHRSFPSLGSHFCCGGFPALSGNTCVSIGLQKQIQAIPSQQIPQLSTKSMDLTTLPWEVLGLFWFSFNYYR